MTTIKLKNGSGAPTAGDLAQGEPALDLTNKRLYTEDSGGTVIEVGTNPTSVTTGDITATGTATFAGLTTTADVSFGDNDKAIFGAGSDLQIYHDGSHSFIKDTGVGDLYIFASDALKLVSATGEGMATFNANGDVSLRYDNATKLATTSTGIDVTGTVTADGLNLDGNIQGDTGQNMQVSAGAGAGDKLDLRAGDDVRIYVDGATAHKLSANFANNGDISFYEDTGTTAKLFWDASAESLGIGTSSPTNVSNYNSISVDGTTGSLIDSYYGGTLGGRIQAYSSKYLISAQGASLPLALGTNNTEAMRIDSNGHVGIAHTDFTNYSGKLVVADGSVGGSSFIDIHNNNNNQFVKIGINNNTALIAYDNADEIAFGQMADASGTSLATEHMRIDASGNVGINTSSPSSYSSASELVVDTGVGGGITVVSDSTVGGYGALFFADGTTGNQQYRGYVQYNHNNGGSVDELLFGTAGVEAMRIDSSGHVIAPYGVTLGTAVGTYAAANTLDDYEEGTFDAEFADAETGGNTASIATLGGTYVKVGSLVTINIYMLNIDTTGLTATNSIFIRNLPFVAAGGETGVWTGSMFSDRLTFTDMSVPYVFNGKSFFKIMDIVSNGADSELLVSSVTSGTADLYFSLSYRV